VPPLEKPRLDATLLTIKGEATAAPVKPTAIDSLASLAHKKTQTVTITYRVDPERHAQLKRAAVEYGISIQTIIDHALKQIGL
jgi:hypothetical protein